MRRETRLGLRRDAGRDARRYRRRPLRAALLVVAMALALAGLAVALRPNRALAPAAGRQSGREPGRAGRAMPSAEVYPYGGEDFSRFIAESYGTPDGPRAFYGWLDAQLPRTAALGPVPASWNAWLDERRVALSAIPGAGERSQAERQFLAVVHRRVKLAIPRFSLDRGFEFKHTVRYGERQCFLQSVLIAGLLQRAGLDAGVAMVYRNPEGETSNNGHAVTLARLSDGSAIIVDASEQHPFVTHEGLFAWDASAGDYRYLDPDYDTGSPTIRSFNRVADGGKVPADSVRTLPLDFLRSQFEYYRGERAPGGVVAKSPTPAGMMESARSLRRSANLCPQNPLAFFMLAKAEDALDDAPARDRDAATARRLYARYGWTPGGIPEEAGS